VKIILRSDVRDLGRAGELVEVKEGYARNYLLPRSLAVPATPGNVKDYNKRIAAAKEREERERAAANDIGNQLRGRRIVIIQRAVEGGTRIHGSVTSQDIAETIQKTTGHQIDRRDVDVRKPIRSLGEYQVNVKLMRGLSVPINVLVAETEPVEPVEEEAQEEPSAEEQPVEEPVAAEA
jgi:large subunit ribosomal protein L9